MSGNFTNQLYDTCQFENRTKESLSPYGYQLFRGKFVNGNRCQVAQNPFISLIDTESELKNITRQGSKCGQFKYDPRASFYPKGINTVLSTYNPLVPINLDPSTCPQTEAYLYFNNGLLKPTNSGVKWPSVNIC